MTRRVDKLVLAVWLGGLAYCLSFWWALLEAVDVL